MIGLSGFRGPDNVHVCPFPFLSLPSASRGPSVMFKIILYDIPTKYGVLRGIKSFLVDSLFSMYSA